MANIQVRCTTECVYDGTSGALATARRNIITVQVDDDAGAVSDVE